MHAWLLAAVAGCGSEGSPWPIEEQEGQGGHTPTGDELLPDVLPLALRIDCSQLEAGAEPPATAYVRITTPHDQLGPLIGRVDGDLCALHDTALEPEAPALALRCPPRQLMEYDPGWFCDHHGFEVHICSPGFEAQTFIFNGYSVCNRKRQPSCDSLDRAEVGAGLYHETVYQVIAKPDQDGHCAEFDAAPANLLADDTTYACPCLEEP